jgi:hypothetical protein
MGFLPRYAVHADQRLNQERVVVRLGSLKDSACLTFGMATSLERATYRTFAFPPTANQRPSSLIVHIAANKLDSAFGKLATSTSDSVTL